MCASSPSKTQPPAAGSTACRSPGLRNGLSLFDRLFGQMARRAGPFTQPRRPEVRRRGRRSVVRGALVPATLSFKIEALRERRSYGEHAGGFAEGTAQVPTCPLDQLTDEERKILEALGQGKSDPEITRQLPAPADEVAAR